MTACPDKELLLQGLLDGELDAANAAAVESHLKACAQCDETYRRLLDLRGRLRQVGVAHAAPQGLRARIEAQLSESGSGPVIRKDAARRNPAALIAGAGAAMAAAVAVVIAAPAFTDSGVEHQMVASHVRSLLASHLTDIATSNQHVVRPWFNGKVNFAPQAPELAELGFPLVGGRLDYIDRQVVAAIVYRRWLHTVNLFVRPLGDRRADRDRTAHIDGYSLVEWKAAGLQYAAVSDLDLAELVQFRDAFRSRTPG